MLEDRSWEAGLKMRESERLRREGEGGKGGEKGGGGREGKEG